MTARNARMRALGSSLPIPASPQKVEFHLPSVTLSVWRILSGGGRGETILNPHPDELSG